MNQRIQSSIEKLRELRETAARPSLAAAVRQMFDELEATLQDGVDAGDIIKAAIEPVIGREVQRATFLVTMSRERRARAAAREAKK